MPYNSMLGPDQRYGVDDSGSCHQCEENLDSGRCECLRCEDCDEYIEWEEDIAITEPVKIHVCESCAEKRDSAVPTGITEVLADFQQRFSRCV